MAEALAIIPLIITGLQLAKKYGTKISRLKSSYMDTVDRFRVRLEVQVHCLTHECKQVLLAATVGKDQAHIDHLLDNVGPGGPKDLADLDNQLQSYLGTSQGTFYALMELIVEKINMIGDELGRYAQADEKGKERASIAQRVGHCLSVSIKEERYEQEIEALRRLVGDLRRLRERAAADKPRATLQESATVPARYRTRKQDANMWLMAMSESWSCHTDGHSSHCAKLLLAHEHSRGPACLDVVIQQTAASTSFSANHLLCIQASAVAPEGRLISPESSADDRHEPHGGYDAKRHRTKASGDASSSRVCATPARKRGKIFSSLDEDGGSTCGSLSARNSPFFFPKGEPGPLGYVQCPLRKFEIYPGHCPRGQPRPYLWGMPVSLCKIFERDLDESVRTPHRFWLAKLVVESALVHQGTAWWPEQWTLDRLSFYERPADELSSSLQTLHLSADLPYAAATAAAASADPVSHKRAMRRYGIRNLTLWCVGVALLQIGLWRPVGWEDHEYVRDCLETLEAHPLGRRYTELTDRLINCDFGKGDDLQRTELQDEIYRSVVRELDAAMDDFRRAGIWAH